MCAKVMIDDQNAPAIKLRANGHKRLQQCWELLASNVASVCTVLDAVLWASFK